MMSQNVKIFEDEPRRTVESVIGDLNQFDNKTVMAWLPLEQ